MLSVPDILVLGGGGRQADAWLTGVLAGLEDSAGVDLRSCDYFVGTSAGAVVAARLAAGAELSRPSSKPIGPASGEQSPLPKWAANSAMALAAPFADLGLRVGALPGELVRAAALRVVPAKRAEPLDFRESFPSRRTRWDGRLRIVAVERATGRRVVFGAPGAPRATVAAALAASCAQPLMFPPAAIDGVEYVDGAVWSNANADLAPVDRDAEVLILDPAASWFGPLSLPIRAASRAATMLEASALIARGARVRTITPDRSSALSIGRDLMSGARLPETQAAGYAQGLALQVR